MISEKLIEILPQMKSILIRLKNGEDWGDIWNEIATDRDRSLTSSLCNDDEVDFILERNGYAFLFTFHDRWDVRFLDQPIYWVDPKLYLGLNFELFLNELQHELPGVEIRVGSDSHNKDSMIVNIFYDRIKQAINTAIKNSNG